MINRYGNHEVKLQKIDDKSYKVIYEESKLISFRTGDGTNLNSTDYINFSGGPYIEERMNLKDINKSFPNEVVDKIVNNETGLYIRTK